MDVMASACPMIADRLFRDKTLRAGAPGFAGTYQGTVYQQAFRKHGQHAPPFGQDSEEKALRVES